MANVVKNYLVTENPSFVQECYVNTLVPNVPFNITLLGPSGVSPYEVTWIVTTEATTRDPVFLKHDDSLDDTSNDTITMEPDTVSGGDITGAVVKVTMRWNAAASGGIS